MRAGKFREEHDTCLQVNSPLIVKLIDKVTKIEKTQEKTKKTHKAYHVLFYTNESGCRNLNMRDVFAPVLGSLFCTLAYAYNSLWKRQRRNLLLQNWRNIYPQKTFPQNYRASVYIELIGWALCKIYHLSYNKIFARLAKSVLHVVRKESSDTQRNKPGSRQNECPFKYYLFRRTWFKCLQLSEKELLCWINMYSCKFNCIFVLAIFQKENQFKITWIHVSGTIHFSVCRVKLPIWFPISLLTSQTYLNI